MKATLGGIVMGYDDTGTTSTPLVLLHAFPFDRAQWIAQTRGLADVVRVIAPDLRGFGETELGSGAIGLDTYAGDVAALLNSLGIERAVIGGLSMGGYTAFAFYRRYPDRARGLILADTRPQPDSPEARQGRDDNMALVRAQGPAALAEKMLPKMLTPRTVAERPNVVKAVHAAMARQPAAGIIAALGALRDRPDSTPLLAQIAVPTLVIAGAEDAITPLPVAQLMCDRIPGARLAAIAGAAHLSNCEQPEAFNAAVRAWIDG